MPLHGKEFFPKRGNFFFQELMSKQARIDNCRKDSIWAISPRHIAFYNWINGNSIEIWSSNALHLDQCPPGTIFSKIVYCIYPIYVDSSKKNQQLPLHQEEFESIVPKIAYKFLEWQSQKKWCILCYQFTFCVDFPCRHWLFLYSDLGNYQQCFQLESTLLNWSCAASIFISPMRWPFWKWGPIRWRIIYSLF